jgi:hypothetical protein
MPRTRPQARTRKVTAPAILEDPNFERGLREAREGVPFDPDNGSWEYERGRQYAHIVPIGFMLFNRGRVNPIALKVFRIAFARGWIK